MGCRKTNTESKTLIAEDKERERKQGDFKVCLCQ